MLGINDEQADRHGSAEHQYWIARLASQLRGDGYEVTKEAPIGGGKTIDLVAERNGRRIAFEIETGKSDAGANVRKCLDAGMNQVIVVATRAFTKRRIASALPTHPRLTCVTPTEALSGKGFALEQAEREDTVRRVHRQPKRQPESTHVDDQSRIDSQKGLARPRRSR